MAIQVNKAHYGARYLHAPRWFSYWLQIKSLKALSATSRSVLVVGVGDGVVPHYLQVSGWRVTTVDIAADLQPDQSGDVRTLPFTDEQFDLVLCAEVLEHLPWLDLPKALREIKRVSKIGAVLSLPDARSTLLDLSLKLPWLPRWEIFLKIANWRYRVTNPQHHWELGRPGYALATVKKVILDNGFAIDQDFTRRASPTIHFFILRKI